MDCSRFCLGVGRNAFDQPFILWDLHDNCATGSGCHFRGSEVVQFFLGGVAAHVVASGAGRMVGLDRFGSGGPSPIGIGTDFVAVFGCTTAAAVLLQIEVVFGRKALSRGARRRASEAEEGPTLMALLRGDGAAVDAA
jgi:hypothetical protein